MKTVHFTFSTKLTFDDDVHGHSFALRVIPPKTEVQHILSCDLSISPLTSTCQTVDAFGNNVTSGYLQGEHRFLDFAVKGTAEVDLSRSRTDFMSCYRYQSDYTKPDEYLRSFYEKHKPDCQSTEIPERVAYFSALLGEVITYKKNVTNKKMTDPEAFAAGAGVCQDFAHLLISLLRMDGIPARYIAGGGIAFASRAEHLKGICRSVHHFPAGYCYADGFLMP